ncbi:MAG: universal stress protein [Deltaproteobacteria bacterium]
MRPGKKLLIGAPVVGVTILRLFNPADSDFFESPEEATAHNTEENRREEEVMAQLREILIVCGMPETSIQMKRVTIDNKSSPADIILSEIHAGGYDTVVIGKHPRTKSQEFIIGSTTVKLVREGAANVIAVKVPGETKQGA